MEGEGSTESWTLLASALALLIVHATRFDFVNDDAFISFRYADNLVRHGELTFNVGERVEGYTNFAWTLLMAGVLALGRDPVFWSKALGLAFGMATLVGVTLHSRWWLGWSRQVAVLDRSLAWCSLAALLLAASPAFAAWSGGGLETAMFTFLVTMGVLRHVRETRDESASWPVSAVLLALASMTRPEGLLVAAVVALHRLGAGLLARRSGRVGFGEIQWFAVLSGLYAPYWIWRFLYYGHLMPNTFYVKAARPLWEQGWRYSSSFLVEAHVWLVVLGVAVAWKSLRGRRDFFVLIAMICVPYGVHVTRVGGDFMALHRFGVPLLPLLAVAAQEAIAVVAAMIDAAAEERLSWAASRRLRWAAALVGIALLGALGVQAHRAGSAALEVDERDGIDSIGRMKQLAEQLGAIGQSLQRRYPPETSLATTAAGAIPYYSRMRTLDLHGLNDLYTAHYVEAEFDRPGHAKIAPLDYVLRWNPDLLLFNPRLTSEASDQEPAQSRALGRRGYETRRERLMAGDPPAPVYWTYFAKRDLP